MTRRVTELLLLQSRTPLHQQSLNEAIQAPSEADFPAGDDLLARHFSGRTGWMSISFSPGGFVRESLGKQRRIAADAFLYDA